jgi:hypothetical protein
LEQLQEATGNTLDQISIENNFLNRTQKAKNQRERMNKWDCFKLKSFCTAVETVTSSRDCPLNGRKSLPATHLIKRLVSRIYRKLKKLNLQRIKTLMKKWAHELNREFQRKRYKYPVNM